MLQVASGQRVTIVTADRKTLTRVAMSGVVRGSSINVVWVCTDEELQAAQREGRQPQGVPWPADAVSVLSNLDRTQAEA
jgi:hypothetical protein